MCDKSYLVDVLALKLGDELVETVGVSIDADGLEDLLDVFGGGRGVSTEAEEKVGCEVLHFDGGVWVSWVKNRSSIDLTCCCQYADVYNNIKRYAHRADGD